MNETESVPDTSPLITPRPIETTPEDSDTEDEDDVDALPRPSNGGPIDPNRPLPEADVNDLPFDIAPAEDVTMHGKLSTTNSFT